MWIKKKKKEEIMPFKYLDKVKIISGFYSGHTAIVIGEAGCMPWSDQFHYCVQFDNGVKDNLPINILEVIK